MDHAILVVGYDSMYYAPRNEQVDYWILMNSWGVDWGETLQGISKTNKTTIQRTSLYTKQQIVVLSSGKVRHVRSTRQRVRNVASSLEEVSM